MSSWNELRKYLLCGICFAFVPCIALQPHIALAKGSTSHSSLFVRLHDGKIIYEKNPRESLVPASVSKLITAAAVLELLGAQTRLKTPIYVSGEHVQPLLKGNIYFKGRGDPNLITENLLKAAFEMRLMGIQVVAGDLVIDNSYFEKEDGDRREGASQSHNSYDAPISALGVNYNNYEIGLYPLADVGGKPIVSILPSHPENIQLQNQVTISKSRNKIGGVRKSPKGKSDKIILSGMISKDSGLKKIYRSVGNPEFAAGQLLKSVLAEVGIHVKGRIKVGEVPASARKLAEIESEPISNSIVGMNTYSNNYIADMYTKLLGAQFGVDLQERQSPSAGSFLRGSQVLKAYLLSKMSDKEQKSNPIALENGSGLTFENKFSSLALVSLLMAVYQQPELFPEFLGSLPVPGEDGTLKDRFSRYPALVHTIRAKTGTLTNPFVVASIAGYLFHKKHGYIAFSIIENAKGGALKSIWNSHEDIINSVVKGLD